MAEFDLLMKQWVAVIDRRTTVVCLHAAGQIRPVGEDFETLAGNYAYPPAHVHCRAIPVPWMPGMLNPIREAANEELQRRPMAQRRIGPGGEIGGYIPPPPAVQLPGRTPVPIVPPDDDQ